jgi:hypothetical protein
VSDEGYLNKSPDASRMGKAVEHLVAASCIIATRGKLNVSTSLVDDEGVDLVFHRRNSSATLAVQVKSRMSDSKRVSSGGFVAFVRSQTFRPRSDLDLLFVAVDIKTGTYTHAWLVPSPEFAAVSKPNARGRLRFGASLSPGSRDRWHSYRVSPAELPQRVLDRLDDLERTGD